MKPTPQISSKQTDQLSFPKTDHNFRTADIPARSAAVLSTKKPAALQKLSPASLGPEMVREYAAELLCFTVITAAALWPVIAALHALTRMVRRY